DLTYLPFLYGKGIAQYTSDPVFTARLRSEVALQQSGGRRRLLPSLRLLFSLAGSYPGPRVKNLLSPLPRRAVQEFIDTYSRPSLVWDNIERLRSYTYLPIVLKGILSPSDAKEAARRGVDALIVSNHGGRQIDGEVAAIDALPGVVDAVGKRLPVLFDSGIRGGADIFKALALGARAVCIGRPYVYALAAAGERGVRELIENLLAELELTMALAGCAKIAEIGRDHLSM
ncbi:MAG TPA: alpha-hydroxy-acid oxidizing protein, partial [Spirochaetia bacterium]|nr:alpha-hydroxy-acid oxidizing protein [Spirochaetia bacterium]